MTHASIQIPCIFPIVIVSRLLLAMWSPNHRLHSDFAPQESLPI
jgi:hypothetical protein